MSIHDEMDALADVYAGGGLGAGERLEVERHAASCGACAAALRDARDFASWLRGAMAPDAPPADLEDRIVGRLWKSSARPKRRWRWLPRGRVLSVIKGLAAAALLVVIGSVFSQSREDGISQMLSESVAHAFKQASVDTGGSPPSANELGGYLAFPTINGLVQDGVTQTKSNLWVAEGGPVHLRMGAASSIASFRGGHSAAPPKPHSNQAVNLLRQYNAAVERETQLTSIKGESEKLAEKGENLAKAKRIDHLQKHFDTVNVQMTKLLADQDVLTRQLEVQQAQIQDMEQKAGEYRNRLQKALSEKSTAVSQLQHERQLVERLEQDLVELEKKHTETPREKKVLEEKIQYLNQMGTRTEVIQDTPVQQHEVVPALFQDNRKIIRNARVDLEVESCETAQRKVAEVAAAEKGFVAGADTERLPNNKMKAVVTLRVPPERFEAVLARLRELGTVRHQSITSQEVTKAYMDLEARLGSKQALVDRLKKVLAEAKGNVKELMEVEVQMGKTIEEIESIKGELKYYDNQVALATIILRIAEKDLGQPFEYVQTLQSAIGLTVKDPDDAYAKAQKAITDAGGQVVDSKMTRQNDGSAQATIKGRVDAEKFPAVREDLRKLGHVDNDTVDQQKTARGGSSGAAKPDAPVRRELAMIDLTIATPPILVTRKAQVIVESAKVEDAYQTARKAVEDAGGRITSGSLSGQSERMSGRVQGQLDAEKFSGLVEQLKALGKVKNAGVSIELPANATGGTARPIIERAELEFVVVSPPRLIPEEKGLVKVIRDTFSGSVAGLLWSIEKLFVGICLAGPWLVIPVVAWIVWRRRRKAKAAAPPG